jgi:hypothetical protein
VHATYYGKVDKKRKLVLALSSFCDATIAATMVILEEEEKELKAGNYSSRKLKKQDLPFITNDKIYTRHKETPQYPMEDLFLILIEIMFIFLRHTNDLSYLFTNDW